jgi:stage II sporulation protein R
VDVQLCEEPFDIRSNNSFTVPSGVYHALKIVIGDGAGENWWCVAFPGLCIIAAGEDFEAVTAAAGFPRSLQKTLTRADECELRFGILEVLGELENILFAE